MSKVNHRGLAHVLSHHLHIRVSPPHRGWASRREIRVGDLLRHQYMVVAKEASFPSRADVRPFSLVIAESFGHDPFIFLWNWPPSIGAINVPWCFLPPDRIREMVKAFPPGVPHHLMRWWMNTGERDKLLFLSSSVAVFRPSYRRPGATPLRGGASPD